MHDDFFDYNSTTPVDKSVLNQMLPYFSECFANPSAQTSMMSLKAQGAIEKAKQDIADFIGSKSSEITFTSGATESINWVFEEFFKAEKNVLVSKIDHDASFEKTKSNSLGKTYACDSKGQIDFKLFEKQCESLKPKSLVNFMLAHNELGTIIDLKSLITIAKKHAHFTHIDATQALGKTDFNFKESQADFLSCSAHKFYGPKGIGALIVNSQIVSLSPLILGGGQQGNLRSGTLNTPLIVGFGAAAELAKKSLKKDQEHYQKLKSAFLNDIKDLKFTLNFDTENSLKNTINITFDEWKSPSPLHLELLPYSVSQGSACSSSTGASRILSSIGQKNLSGTLRISFGRGSKRENTASLAKKLISLLSKS